MDAIMERDAKRAAAVVNKIREEHGRVGIMSTPFTAALNAAPDEVRARFYEFTGIQGSTTRYQRINYEEVLGSEDLSFRTIGLMPTSDYVEIPNNVNDDEIISILKNEGILKKGTRKESIEIDRTSRVKSGSVKSGSEAGWDTLFFRHARTGKPLFELKPVFRRR